jgi:threonine aldolase
MTAPHAIDLRSDTLTQPTPEMRRAMMEAPVGDDVFGEDPTIRRLEEAAAQRVGKEAAVFMPSGTMVNQSAIWVHSQRQGAIIVEEGAHVYAYEAGAPALLSNVLVKTVKARHGILTPELVAPLIPPASHHFAQVKLIAMENTHNRAGGTCFTPEETRALADFAHGRGIPVHLDGARVFNAAIAQGVPVQRLTAPVDSVAFCLSKGLSAPVGSLLCGTAPFVQEARRVRKILGGGMRQAGVLAAAGLVALETMVDRLAEDHANARRLAEGIQDAPGIKIDMTSVQTNIVLFDVQGAGMTPQAFCEALLAKGVKCLPRDTGWAVRMVTHRHITRQDVETTIECVHEVLSRRVPTASKAR